MRRRNDESGFAAAEWVAAIGLLFVPTYLVVMSATRVPEVRSNAQIMATEAARAGVQAPSCEAARTAALNAASSLKNQLRVSDLDPQVKFDGTSWESGGSYRVTVSMDVPVVFVPGGRPLALPFAPSLTATHSEPIDVYRFIDPPTAPCTSPGGVPG